MESFLIMGRSVNSVPQFQPVIDNPEYNVWFSYGETVPKLGEKFLFWGAGKFANSVKTVRPDFCFMSPGATWLPKLPEEFLGRTIVNEKFCEAVEHFSSSKVWFKFSEMKHELVPAAVYIPDTLKSIMLDNPELYEVDVQWTADLLQFNYEHRFFIIDGVPITGSPYLVDGQVYSPAISWHKYEEALKFASYVAKEIVDNAPPAYTLDVGWDEKQAKWVIVEGNRVWSSGLYGSNPLLFMEALKVSLTASDWEWVPDAVVNQYTIDVSEALVTEEHSGFFKLPFN